MPSFGELNPLAGLPRLFSKRQFGDAMKACLLALLLGGVGAFCLSRNLESFGSALTLPLPTALSHADQVLLGGLGSIVLVLALYAHAEIDREIPAALFAAVAQVLACVYQLRAALSGAAPMPDELPELNVPAELDPQQRDE